MAPHEFAFANGLCGRVERALSEAGDSDAEDDPAESEDEYIAAGKVVKFAAVPTADAGATASANNASAALLMPPSGRNIVGETIREESEPSSNVLTDDEEEGVEAEQQQT